MKSEMMRTLENISRHEEGRHVINGYVFVLKDECANDYYKDRLPSIPAGTALVADFAGDFGIYGMVDIGGVLNRVKIDLNELHKIDFGPFDARNRSAAA